MSDLPKYAQARAAERDPELAEGLEAGSSDFEVGAAETLIALSRRCSALPDLGVRDADEILGYDDKGLFG